MNKNVQIVNTVTAQSASLDAIASNVIAGNYSTAELHGKLSSVANVLSTTASAQAHILGQVSDIESFTTVASTTDYDNTLSVVLATQAQATLVGQMIKGTLGIVCERFGYKIIPIEKNPTMRASESEATAKEDEEESV